MRSYLPPIYEKSNIIYSLTEASGNEFDVIRQTMDELIDQTFLKTVTWNLMEWEIEYGTPIGRGTFQERVERLKAKLRGWGTATLYLITYVLSAYTFGRAVVMEDHAAYTVTVRFIDEMGTPTLFESIQEIMRELIPAHLDLKYEFAYFTWDKLDAQNWTWDVLNALQLMWSEIPLYPQSRL